MTFEEAQNYIQEKNRLGSVLGLDNIKELLSRLDNPQDKCSVIHIAGTNGKGSILACLNSILNVAGYKVGRYTSPTIFCYLERFQIDEEYMEEAVFASYLTRVADIVEDMALEGYQVTAFEIETAIAFLYFYEQKVDIILLETGMGGRLDATNVVKCPLCTILSSISYDHMAILGDTIEAIAHEKCGILRDHVPCVVYPVNDLAMSVIKEECRAHNISPIVPDLSQVVVKKHGLKYEDFDYKNVNYKLALLGQHQIYNAVTAIEVLKALKEAHIKQIETDFDKCLVIEDKNIENKEVFKDENIVITKNESYKNGQNIENSQKDAGQAENIEGDFIYSSNKNSEKSCNPSLLCLHLHLWMRKMFFGGGVLSAGISRSFCAMPGGMRLLPTPGRSGCSMRPTGRRSFSFFPAARRSCAMWFRRN